MADRLRESFGVCTDEVHQDLEIAFQFATAMGMRWVELLACYALGVSAIGSLFLKGVQLGHVRRGEVAQDPAFREELAVLRASIRVAKRLDAPIVRTFGFRRDDMVGLGNPSPRLPRGGEVPDEILEKAAEGLRIAAQITADAGLILGLENVRSCWANSGYNTGRIIAATGHPALKALWDPGNDYVAGGVPYPEGYDAVRPQICHVHVKDARVVDPRTG